MRCARGFTLIELVVVITVMGILAVGTVKFITDASDGYAGTVRRTELGSTARLAGERVSRELRTALPNSVRTTGSCIEFIPIVGASTYRAIPVSAAASTFEAAPPTAAGSLTGTRVAIEPDSSGGVYALGNPGSISPLATFSTPDADNYVTVTLTTAHRFSAESSQRRLFIVSGPISFCVDGDYLYRYEGYGFVAAQPSATSLPIGPPGRAVVGVDLGPAGAPFSVGGAAATRNAIVTVHLSFVDGADAIEIDQRVQLRNVP